MKAKKNDRSAYRKRVQVERSHDDGSSTTHYVEPSQIPPDDRIGYGGRGGRVLRKPLEGDHCS